MRRYSPFIAKGTRKAGDQFRRHFTRTPVRFSAEKIPVGGQQQREKSSGGHSRHLLAKTFSFSILAVCGGGALYCGICWAWAERFHERVDSSLRLGAAYAMSQYYAMWGEEAAALTPQEEKHAMVIGGHVLPPHSKAKDPFFMTNRDLFTWEEVAPFINPGDIILMMGTGEVSKKICALSYAASGMNPNTLRYSHVGVAVGRDRFGIPLMLEAVDNTDVHTKDVNGKVRYNQVQVVPIASRVYGKENARWCYTRCAVRRLEGVKWTPERQAALRKFIEETEGRPLERSKKVMLAFVSPLLYSRKDNEISCSELIAETYKALGLLQDPNKLNSVSVAPAHFAEGVEGKIKFVDGVKLSKEIRVIVSEDAADQ